MEYIDGKDFFTSKEKITKKDRTKIVSQAALINSMDIKPRKIYDSWAISNFRLEFQRKSRWLELNDLKRIQPLLRTFQNLKIKTLPHCFVHGDLIRTNILKDKKGKIWVVDFSVANWYPRIQELAVLACDILFNEKSRKESKKNMQEALGEYQKTIKLTDRELKSLPRYIELAHAMHVLRATYEKRVNGNKSRENNYFLRIGRAGLKQAKYKPNTQSV